MTCHHALILLLALSTVVGAAEIPASDERIELTGRWDVTNRDGPWCAWQSSKIRASFRGKSVVADVESSNKEDYVRVIIDGDNRRSKKLKLMEGRHDYPLATDLEDGLHTVEVVKETYSGKGRMTLCGLKVSAGELVASTFPKPRLRIQFYGDSNLAGYSLEHERNKNGWDVVGCHNSFAGIASRMLGAEYQNISVSGAVTRGEQNSVMSFHDRIDYYTAEPRWDFGRFPADVCVVNIGANDINRKSESQIRDDFKLLLEAIRQAHPKSHIVVMNAYGWSRKEPANYTQEIVKEFGDDNMSRLVFPWFFNEWHGCEYDHAGMAIRLVEHLETLNPHWKRIRESDVMNGFASDGVANGSFEHVAPFGGFGWRYVEEGVQRVRDPESAAEGEWYVRLMQGTEIHQPRPAKKGVRYGYALKMRSSTDSDAKQAIAKVRLEFRDQQWRNEVPDSAREFVFNPDSNWKEYRFTATAPSGPEPKDPSYDPWQIILRMTSEAGLIEVDDVRVVIQQGAK